MSFILPRLQAGPYVSFRNIAQVTGGERELRSMYLKPFNRACVESLAIMTAYSSYDGIPAIANTRELFKLYVLS